jgi:hypothetical protein
VERSLGGVALLAGPAEVIGEVRFHKGPPPDGAARERPMRVAGPNYPHIIG